MLQTSTSPQQNPQPKNDTQTQTQNRPSVIRVTGCAPQSGQPNRTTTSRRNEWGAGWRASGLSVVQFCLLAGAGAAVDWPELSTVPRSVCGGRGSSFRSVEEGDRHPVSGTCPAAGGPGSVRPMMAWGRAPAALSRMAVGRGTGGWRRRKGRVRPTARRSPSGCWPKSGASLSSVLVLADAGGCCGAFTAGRSCVSDSFFADIQAKRCRVISPGAGILVGVYSASSSVLSRWR